MRTRLTVVALIVVTQLVVIYFLLRPDSSDYAVTVSPMYRSDLTIATSSDRLAHYYDLSGENSVFVPDWLPYTPEYERNADRLNDRYDYAVPKPKGHYRILTLGDSWTFGMHVSTRDNYSEQLEDMLNERLTRGEMACRGIERFDVINLGLGGYDIAYMVESLRLRGMPYEPDLVIPLIKNDDFVVVNELWQPKIAAYQAEYDSLEARVVDGVAVNPRQEIAARIIEEIGAAHSQEELEEMGIEELRFMDSFYPGPVLFFLYGMPEKQEERVRAYAQARDSSYVHRETMLVPSEKVPHDEHPGSSGHERFAEGLFGTLIEQEIIPCDVR